MFHLGGKNFCKDNSLQFFSNPNQEPITIYGTLHFLKFASLLTCLSQATAPGLAGSRSALDVSLWRGPANPCPSETEGITNPEWPHCYKRKVEFSKGYDQFVTKIYSLKQLVTEYLLIVLHPEEQADGLIQPSSRGSWLNASIMAKCL